MQRAPPAEAKRSLVNGPTSISKKIRLDQEVGPLTTLGDSESANAVNPSRTIDPQFPTVESETRFLDSSEELSFSTLLPERLWETLPPLSSVLVLRSPHGKAARYGSLKDSDFEATILSYDVVSHLIDRTTLKCRVQLPQGSLPKHVLVLDSAFFEVQILPLQECSDEDSAEVVAAKGLSSPSSSKRRSSPRVQSSSERGKTRFHSPERREKSQPAKRNTKTQIANFVFVVKARPIEERGIMEMEAVWCFLEAESRAILRFKINLEPLVERSTRLRLNMLFRSVHGREPMSILFWGVMGAGKTSLASTLINIIHSHSSGSKVIDHSVITDASPNPIIQYPSTLVNLLDVSSLIVRDITALMKTMEFLDKRGARCDAVVFVINLEDSEIDFRGEALLGFDWARKFNKIPILVLTHIESIPQQELESIIIEMRATFKHVIPISCYTRQTTERSTWTESAGTEILYLARKPNTSE